MVPLHKLKDTPGYQFVLAEGREEGREALEEVFLSLIKKKFPGLELKEEIDCIHDLNALKNLCFSLDQIADAKELRAKINELVTKN